MLFACGTWARPSSTIPANDMKEPIMYPHPSVRQSIEGLHKKAPGSIGDSMEFQVLEENRERGEYLLRCKTESWMRNALGTLHGGCGATVVDQAIGFVAYSYMTGPGTAPTIQMNLNYHHPLIPGEEVVIRVRVMSISRTLICMAFEASQAENPEKICISGSGTSYLRLDKK